MYTNIERHNISQEAYFALPGVSNSDIGLFLERPALYKASQAGWSKPPTRPMIIGSAFDTLLLEPEQFAARYRVSPPGMDEPTTDMQAALAKGLVDGLPADEAFAQAGYKRVDPATVEKLKPYVQFVRDSRGFDALSHAEKEMLDEMVASVRGNAAAMRVISRAEKQVVFTGVHEATGIAVKGMLDLWYPGVGVFDIKTTGEQMHRFEGKIFRSGYDRQLAHYCALAGEENAGLIAVERESVFHECDCFRLSPETLERGMAKMDRALKDMAVCMQNDFDHRPHYFTNNGWRVV